MTDLWNKWLLIGIAGAPFGLAGEIKIHPETDFPERYQLGRRVFVRWKKGQEPVERTIKTLRWHKGSALVRFEDCASREDAERYTGAEILVPESDRMELDEDQYYVPDLMGMDVYTDDGRYLGKIDNVLQYSANDVYVVGKILIPAIKSVVQEVDVPGKRMTIFPMPGLLPEEQDED